LRVKILAIGLFLVFVISSFGTISVKIQEKNTSFVPGQVIVGLSEDINDLNIGDKDPILGKSIVDTIPPINIIVVSVEIGKEDQYIEKYACSPLVKFAEKNGFMYATDVIPDDPMWDKQWGPKNIKCPQAWQGGTGSSDVIVAIIDSGVDYNHPDLKNNMWTDSNGNYGKDFVDDDENPMDELGHGTHCAGIVAAKMDDYGIAGVAQVKIMAVRILDEDGEAGSFSDITNGITYAADNGADVLSMSFGTYTNMPLSVLTACDYAWNAGAVLVASAGNDNVDRAHYPSSFENVICVAASTSNNEKAGFSNYGSDVDVVAPGLGILSTFLDGNYEFLSGTSMACPHVAGVAALAKSQHPSWSNNQIRQMIFDTADPIGGEGVHWKYGKVDATFDDEDPPGLPSVFVKIHKLTNQGSGLDSIDLDGNPEWCYNVKVSYVESRTITNFDFGSPSQINGGFLNYYIENYKSTSSNRRTWNIDQTHTFNSDESIAAIEIKVLEDDFVFDCFSDIADISSRSNPGGDYEIGYDERGRVFKAKYDLVNDIIIDEESDQYKVDGEWYYTRGDWDGSTGPEIFDWKQDDAKLWFDIFDDYEKMTADAGGSYSGFVNKVVTLSASVEGGLGPYIYSWDLNYDETYDAQGESIQYKWENPGTYNVALLISDGFGQTSYAEATVTIAKNNAPNTPTISGSTSGTAGKKYSYSIYTIDPEEDNVEYYVEWGDGSNSGWQGPYISGESITLSHEWEDTDTYTIRVKAKDDSGEESNWGTLEVKMPYIKSGSSSPFLRLLNRRPVFKKIIEEIIQFRIRDLSLY